MYDVVRSDLRGLQHELLEFAPFALGETHRPAVVIAEDDLFGIGEIDGRAAPLGAAQRQHACVGLVGFFVQIAIHDGSSIVNGPQAKVQSVPLIDKDRL